MFGANKHEGRNNYMQTDCVRMIITQFPYFFKGIFVANVVYGSFILPNDLENDEDFLRYEIVPTLLHAMGKSFFLELFKTIRASNIHLVLTMGKLGY